MKRRSQRSSRIPFFGAVGIAVGLILAGCTPGRVDPSAPGTQQVDAELFELAEGEKFVAVSPSGTQLVTSSEADVVGDSWRRQVCVIELIADQRWCVDVTRNDAGYSGATWSPDGSRLAVFEAANGIGAGVFWLLDLNTRQLTEVSAIDEPRDGDSALAWVDDDELLYSRTLEDETEIRRVDLDAAVPETSLPQTTVITTVKDRTVNSLTPTDAGMAIVTEDRGQYEVGFLELNGDDTAEVRVERTVVGRVPLGVDPTGRFVVLQFMDVHAQPAPELQLVAGDAELIDLPVPVPAEQGRDLEQWGWAWSSDGSELASLTVDTTGTALLGTVPFNADGTGGEAVWLSAQFNRVPDSYTYDGVFWTERGLLTPISPDGRPQQILIIKWP